jgi:hypothetical protein
MKTQKFFVVVLVIALLAAPGMSVLPILDVVAQSQDLDHAAVSAPLAPPVNDWVQAGYPGEIPNIITNIIDVKDAGAVGDGITDDVAAIQAVIDNVTNPAVIYFPPGTYRIEDVLTLKSGIVIRGAGYQQTHIACLNAGGCISAQGSIAGSFVSVQSGLGQGSNQIVVADASEFSVGQGAQIQQDDIVPPSASWGSDAVGQMVKIVAVNGNTLTIDPVLHITYTSDKNPQIRPINFIEQVGIEDLHLQRISSGYTSDNNNINFRRAADSWIRRVESDNTEKYHFAVSESLHLEFRDSYIHDAESKGDGGEGYGVSLGRHVTSVLVENNIFNELRHAMIIQIGTNGCVFGYNYAQRNYSDDGWDKSYISLHGHYPFTNLFESNIVGWAYLGDYWGDIGPDNTMFRNRVVGTDKHEDFGPYRGVALRYFHGPQYVVGNEVTGEDGIYFASDATGNPDDVVIHGNNVLGIIEWDPSLPQTLPDSYYLSGKPGFYGSMDWPSLGGDLPLGQGAIPALLRWEQGDYIPSAEALSLRAKPDDQSLHLSWEVYTSLPTTTTWTITYEGPMGNPPSPIEGLPEPTRAYSLTGLTNYAWYNLTLSTNPAGLTDTVRIMPTDQIIYLPMIRNED